jgi:hypothetical protein
VTDARITQVALEHWSQGNPAARTTQQAVEVWSTLTVGTGQAVITLVGLEQWAVVAATATVAEQYAVTVIT